MKQRDVVMVHTYLTKGGKRLNELMQLPHDKEQVGGVTGFGNQGHIYSPGLIDMSFDLPLVVELFNTIDKTAAIINDLQPLIESGHVVSRPAAVYE